MIETTYFFPEQHIFQLLKLISKFEIFLLVQVFSVYVRVDFVVL